MRKRKFVQITNGPSGLYALDNAGQVWVYVWSSEGSYWGLLTTERKS